MILDDDLGNNQDDRDDQDNRDDHDQCSDAAPDYFDDTTKDEIVMMIKNKTMMDFPRKTKNNYLS